MSILLGPTGSLPVIPTRPKKSSMAPTINRNQTVFALKIPSTIELLLIQLVHNNAQIINKLEYALKIFNKFILPS